MEDNQLFYDMIKEINKSVKSIDNKLDTLALGHENHEGRLKTVEEKIRGSSDDSKWVVGMLLALIASVGGIISLIEFLTK